MPRWGADDRAAVPAGGAEGAFAALPGVTVPQVSPSLRCHRPSGVTVPQVSSSLDCLVDGGLPVASPPSTLLQMAALVTRFLPVSVLTAPRCCGVHPPACLPVRYDEIVTKLTPFLKQCGYNTKKGEPGTSAGGCRAWHGAMRGVCGRRSMQGRRCGAGSCLCLVRALLCTALRGRNVLVLMG